MTNKRFFSLCFMIGFVIFSAQIQAQNNANAFAADLDYLAEKLPKKHANFEQFSSKENFAAQVNQLKKRLPQLNKLQFRLELTRLLASLNDHSTMVPLWAKYHAFPVQLHWFDNGVYIINTSKQYLRLKGAKVVKINGTPITEVFHKVKGFISSENDHTRQQRFFATRGMTTEVLQHTGVIVNPELATFTLELPTGKVTQVNIRAEPISDFLQRFIYTKVAPVFSPAVANRQQKNYWFKYLPDSKTVYVQFNRLVNQKEESLNSFMERLMTFVDKTDFYKFVVDLRHGGGGSGHRARKIVNVMRGNKKINQESVLFTLIGGKTVGTCAEFATMMELRTKTVLVGTLSGQSPNWVGDIGAMTLPDSQIKIYYTSSFWPISIKQDKRKYLSPQIAVKYRYAHHKNNNDPALKAVKDYPMSSPPFNPGNPTIKKQLMGKYKLGSGRKMTIYEKDGHLFMKMRHISPRSLFAVDTELHVRSDAELRTDIAGVKLKLDLDGNKVKALVLDWKGTEVKVF